MCNFYPIVVRRCDDSCTIPAVRFIYSRWPICGAGANSIDYSVYQGDQGIFPVAQPGIAGALVYQACLFVDPFWVGIIDLYIKKLGVRIAFHKKKRLAYIIVQSGMRLGLPSARSRWKRSFRGPVSHHTGSSSGRYTAGWYGSEWLPWPPLFLSGYTGRFVLSYS